MLSTRTWRAGRKILALLCFCSRTVLRQQQPAASCSRVGLCCGDRDLVLEIALTAKTQSLIRKQQQQGTALLSQAMYSWAASKGTYYTQKTQRRERGGTFVSSLLHSPAHILYACIFPLASPFGSGNCFFPCFVSNSQGSSGDESVRPIGKFSNDVFLGLCSSSVLRYTHVDQGSCFAMAQCAMDEEINKRIHVCI